MLLPRSLRIRAFALIALLIMLSLAASVALLRQAESTPRAHQQALLVVSAVNLTRAAVLSSEPSLRPALLAEMAESEGLRVYPADSREILQPLPEGDAVTRKMTLEVREKLGSKTRFADARNGLEGFWVSFFIGDEEFWVKMPRERFALPGTWHWLGWGVVVLALALAGGALIARQVGKPLRDLANAARAVGRGEAAPIIPETGAEETIAVARAFNQMSDDIAANDRERSLVLAGISHDLRTPLTRLRLSAEFIEDETMRNNLILDVEQMDAVLGQFLDYARLGEQEPAIETDLKKLAEEAAAPYMGRVAGLCLELSDLPHALVRPRLLQRALSNLIDNAGKYADGEIILRLEGCTWQDHPCARFSVLDQGSGIPREKVETIKRPFVRLDASRSGIAGSGLGLAIVERASHLHGGEFRLEPRDPKGLAATVTIPLKQANRT